MPGTLRKYYAFHSFERFSCARGKAQAVKKKHTHTEKWGIKYPTWYSCHMTCEDTHIVRRGGTLALLNLRVFERKEAHRSLVYVSGLIMDTSGLTLRAWRRLRHFTLYFTYTHTLFQSGECVTAADVESHAKRRLSNSLCVYSERFNVMHNVLTVKTSMYLNCF